MCMCIEYDVVAVCAAVCAAVCCAVCVAVCAAVCAAVCCIYIDTDTHISYKDADTCIP